MLQRCPFNVAGKPAVDAFVVTKRNGGNILRMPKQFFSCRAYPPGGVRLATRPLRFEDRLVPTWHAVYISIQKAASTDYHPASHQSGRPAIGISGLIFHLRV